MTLLELILICHNEPYMERFERSVRLASWAGHVSVHRYGSIERYRRDTFIGNGERAVLMEHRLYEEWQQIASDSTRQLVLCLMPHEEETDDDFRLFMYQPVSSIVERVRQLLATRRMSAGEHAASERTAEVAAGEQAKILALSSPYGGSGVTTAAYHAARYLAVRQERVLYLNMDLYPEPLIMPQVDYDFSRLLYQLTTRPQELFTNWQRFCGIHPPSGVYSFRPPPVRRDLRDVRIEHLNELCRLFGQIGFQSIVLDLDAHWLDDLIEEKLHYDECWLIAPWRKHQLSLFPTLRGWLGKPDVRYIVSNLHQQDQPQLDAAELEIDAILPYVSTAPDPAEPILSDGRLEGVIARLLRESQITGGVLGG